MISYAPNLPGVIDAPIRDAVAAATGRRVVVDNDANVAALAEATYGAAVGARHALMVTLGTGIGGGIIADGEVYRGANGFAAEIGHFTVDSDGPICACGELGHWEAIASGNALGRMAREMIEHGRGGTILAAAGGRLADVSGEEVAAAAGEGDADARALLAAYADNVALGLANLANILDPERIVIAGGVVEIGALLFEPLGAAFRAAPRRDRASPRHPDRSRRARRTRRCGRRGRARTEPVKLGLALPSFVDDPEVPIGVARTAEAAGLDGVFVYDHLWRDKPPPRRPALECFALLGAVAAETTRIHVGTLVARATLRPAATLAHSLDAAQRISGGRLIAAIGAGDSESRAENEAFGLPFGTLASRVLALADAVGAARGRGYPVWVGGNATVVREVVAIADGWNTWGDTPEQFRDRSALVRAVAPEAELTWGGLILLGRDREQAARQGRAVQSRLARPDRRARTDRRRTSCVRRRRRGVGDRRTARLLRCRERTDPRRRRRPTRALTPTRRAAVPRRGQGCRPSTRSRGNPVLQNVISANHTEPKTFMMSSRSGRWSPSTASVMIARSVSLISCFTGAVVSSADDIAVSVAGSRAVAVRARVTRAATHRRRVRAGVVPRGGR